MASFNIFSIVLIMTAVRFTRVELIEGKRRMSADIIFNYRENISQRTCRHFYIKSYRYSTVPVEYLILCKPAKLDVLSIEFQNIK